jgi:hypothetical protein
MSSDMQAEYGSRRSMTTSPTVAYPAHPATAQAAVGLDCSGGVNSSITPNPATTAASVQDP